MMTENEMKKYELAETELGTVAAGGVNILRGVSTKDANDSAIKKPGTVQGAQGYRLFR